MRLTVIQKKGRLPLSKENQMRSHSNGSADSFSEGLMKYLALQDQSSQINRVT